MPFIPVLAEVEDQALSACQSSYSFSSEALRDFVLKKKKKQTKKKPNPPDTPLCKKQNKKQNQTEPEEYTRGWPLASKLEQTHTHTHHTHTRTHSLTIDGNEGIATAH